jgi:hypothetical protein
MDKSAQTRGPLNEMREKMNMPAKYLEGFFRPAIERVLKALAQLDDKVRANLSGQKIGDASAPEDKTSIKDIVKSARTNFNRREYIAGFTDLAHFDKKMSEAAIAITEFQKIDLDSIHAQFLFHDLPKDYADKLQHTREYMDNKKEASRQEAFVKEAGLIDFIMNLSTKRGRSLLAWEKKYPQRVKPIKDNGTALVEHAQTLLEGTLSHLKEMATSRATRRPDEYTKSAQKIVEGYNKFDKAFRNYYTKDIKPFLDVKDAIEAKEKETQAKLLAEEAKKKEEANVLNKAPANQVPAAPGATSPIELADVPRGRYQQTTPTLPTNSPPFAPAPAAPVPQFEGELIDPKSGVVLSHNAFYESLQSLSNEDPRILAAYISKYAKSIQKTDLDTAVKLFNIAKRIK